MALVVEVQATYQLARTQSLTQPESLEQVVETRPESLFYYWLKPTR